jgi:hypothetical protein
MTDQELMEWDYSGVIPGPNESEGDFLSRAIQTKQRFEEGKWIPPAHWDWVKESLAEVFHVKPLYICAFYSNRSLTPWQGAACWIDGRTVSSIQLRKALQKGSYLGLYRREEILAHEAIHAARSGFAEQQCEEFFAYMTSEKRWRRVLGPLIQRPWEVWPFLLFLGAGVIWPLCNWGATVWMGLGFARLVRQHSRLKRAAAQIGKRVGHPRTIRAILFRLTDAEVTALARGKDIDAYAQRQSCLRWRVIKNYLRGTYGTENCCSE